MKRLIYLSAIIALSGCTESKKQSPSLVEPDSASPLSEETRTYIRLATQQYHLCLTDGIRSQTKIINDSRETTQVIVNQCESKLGPIRERLLAEKMPASVADRYLRRKRVQATRNILRQVMYMQSQHQSQ